MNKFFDRVAAVVRSALTEDAATVRFLEQNHVGVRKNSRLWGV